MERDNSTRFQSAYIISLTVTNLWGNFLTVDRSRFCRYQVFFQILRNPAVRKHSFNIRRSNVWFFYFTLRTWNIISIIYIYIYIILNMCDWNFKLNETFNENINHGPLHCDHRHCQKKFITITVNSCTAIEIDTSDFPVNLTEGDPYQIPPLSNKHTSNRA